ncbi:MAG: hypothetical protein NXI00_13380 [Cytophagales bacterium]|nr:hypothetical protein [Cytophagales bacterium]
MKKDFLRLVKNILLFGSPVLLLAVSYFIFDPFHVLKHYESYPDNYLKSYNRNRISTQIFLNNNDSLQYRSFIFGSSRSSVFYTQDWANYIKDEYAYHFDASNEDITGIYQKLMFINEQGNPIDNALIILDGESFNPYVDHDNSIIHIRDWRWSGENRFLYHLTFFKAFFKDLYFIKYFDTLISQEYKDYMYGSFENKHMLYTPINNDFIFQGYIDQIKEDSLGYYSRDLFYERDEQEEMNPVYIDEEEELRMLKEIKSLFDQKKTNYKIVFGPGYDQKKLHNEDLEKVKEIFGTDKVFDYTGQNKFTSSLSNFYEIYHYKPLVAREIMDSIYVK